MRTDRGEEDCGRRPTPSPRVARTNMAHTKNHGQDLALFFRSKSLILYKLFPPRWEAARAKNPRVEGVAIAVRRTAAAPHA